MEESKELFEAIASKFNLDSFYDPSAPVEILLRIPEQTGLGFSLTLYLQNYDEHWLDVGPYGSFCMFPYDEKYEHYRKCVEGLITGGARLVLFQQGRLKRTRRADLQLRQGNGWVYAAATTYMFKIPFLVQTKDIIINKEKSN